MTTSTHRRDRSAAERAGRAPARRIQRSRLRLADVLRLGGTGIKARPTRAFLSALGIAIGIAAMISVVGDPPLLLADEPTGNLDSASGASIVELLHELHRQGTTVIVITHDNELAAKLPRQIAIRDGRVVGDSREEEIVHDDVYASV